LLCWLRYSQQSLTRSQLLPLAPRRLAKFPNCLGLLFCFLSFYTLRILGFCFVGFVTRSSH
jgi:hypothetical protein